MSGCKNSSVVNREQQAEQLTKALQRVDFQEVLRSLPEEIAHSEKIFFAHIGKTCRSDQIFLSPNLSDYKIVVLRDSDLVGRKLPSEVYDLDPKLLPELPDNLFLQGSFALAIDKKAGKVFLTCHPANSWNTLITTCENTGTDLSHQWRNL
jgi:hypothetical protein